MSILSRLGPLQDGQFRRGEKVQWCALSVDCEMSCHISHLCTGLLLEKEPTNLQAQSLAQLIEKGAARGILQSRVLSESR